MWMLKTLFCKVKIAFRELLPGKKGPAQGVIICQT